MDTILNKIVEADKAARKLADDAAESRRAAQESIKQRREEVRADYMARANHRLEVLSQTRKTQTEEKTAETAKRFEEQMTVLDRQYAVYKNTWVEHIVSDVLR